MRILILSFFLISTSYAETAKECSAENLKKMLIATAEMSGSIGEFEVKTVILLRKFNEVKDSLADLKTKIQDLSKKADASAFKKISEIDKILETNPECNINNLFKLKK